jgi:hypothetical protein
VPPLRLPRPPDRGQAGIEYAGVLLLVAVALGAAALAADGAGIPQSVHHQMLRALCVARGGDCEQDRAYCPVATDRRRDAVAARILVFRIGKDKTVVREQRSDGTIAVTVAYGKEGGLQAGEGVHVGLSLGHGGLSLGGELTAAAVATRERGYTWVLHDARAADALAGSLGVSERELERLIAARRLPAPALGYEQGGMRVSGMLSRGSAGIGGAVGLSSQDVAGTRTDARTGRTTVYVQRAVDGSLSLTRDGASATGSRGERERYAVTYDAGGRPIDLMVMTTGSFKLSVDLPNRLQPIARLLSTPTGHARLFVEETHLDLTDPENLRAARAFLEQVRHPGAVALGSVVAVSAALRARLDAAGVINARVYDADERRYGVDLSAAVDGVSIGGELSRTHEATHLVAATTRGIDGVWRTRADCLGPA